MVENRPTSEDRSQGSNECSCRGENENCFHCYGTGVIRDRGRPAVATSGDESSKKSERSRTYSRSSVATFRQPCSKCSFHGTPDQLKIHDFEAHTPKLVDCAFCSFVGTDSQLKDHQNLCRAASAARKIKRKKSALYQCDACPFTGSLAVVKSHTQFDHNRRQTHTVCPICHAGIRTNRLEKHVRKAHGLSTVLPSPIPLKTLTVGFHRVSKQKKPVARNSELVTQEDRRAEQKLDHARPYAHAYREQGKFGSHPVHDGFDDESKP